MKKFLALSASLLIWLPLLAGAEDSPPAAGRELLDLAVRVQDNSARVKSLEAEFIRQSDYAAVGADEARQVRGSGRLFWAGPLNLRLEQHAPTQETVVADGTSVWWIRPERRRADVYPIDSFTANLTSLLEVLGGLAKVNEKFFVEQPLPEDLSQIPGELTLALRPQEARADLNRLILWLDEKSLRLNGFKFSNVVGDATRYRLSQIKINPSFPAGVFTYAPPDDYRVNDQRR
ncbi:MAG: outer membrane lipoprotein carrier protein LolA [Desulfarculales bacterium]|nr:outer membrane lipoprotein carrier protein LolA [Desulfarculales bacterium]